jgi:hypothetical protein
MVKTLNLLIAATAVIGALAHTGALSASSTLPASSGALRHTVAEVDLQKDPRVIKYFRMDPAVTPKEWTHFLADRVAEWKKWTEYDVGAVRLVSIAKKAGGYGEDILDFTIASWRYPINPPLDEVWLSYTIMIDRDVKDGIHPQESVKLPGFESTAKWGAFSVRTWHSKPGRATNPVHFGLHTYEYRPDSGDDYGEIVPHSWQGSGTLFEGVIHTVDFHMKLNTAKKPNSGEKADWNKDGIREIWVDDKQVRPPETNVMWRNNPYALIDVLFFNIFHGGSQRPLKPIHYEVGPVMLSKVRGGMIRKKPRS